VNGTRAAFVGASDAEGCVEAETVRPVPAGTTTGEGDGEGDGLIATPLFNSARVKGPTKPVEGRPFIVWNFLTAAAVAGPKYWLSFPGEPGPVAATCVAAFPFKAFWRYQTASPLLPNFKSVVKTYPLDIAGEGDGEGVPPLRDDCTLLIVAASAPNDCKSEMIALTWLGVSAAACAVDALRAMLKASANATKPEKNFLVFE
jgi:hypothetical protein